MTPLEWWSQAAKQLRAAGINFRDAAIILEHTIGFTKVELLTQDLYLSPDAQALADERLRRRVSGEPVAYILGWKEFYGRRFAVDRRVLIPRPETELLAEAILQLVQPDWKCIDVGTGSGCLGITASLEVPTAKWICTDVSRGALEVARDNALSLRANVVLAQANMLDPFQSRAFDAIVSNPPYVANGDFRLEASVLEWEPGPALFAGDDGLLAIRRLVDGALAALKPGGLLAFEFGEGQAGPIEELLAGWHPDLRADLAGITRFVLARSPG